MRPRLLASLPVLLALGCPPSGETPTTGFESGLATTGGPGPSSFGTSGEPSTGTPTTTASTGSSPTTTTTSELASSTGEPITGTTGELSTSTGPDASTTGDTGDTSTSGGMPACGDGIVEADEPCDDGNRVDDDACHNDCTAGTAVLALIGTSTAPAIAAMYTPGPGWTSEPASIGVLEAALVPTPAGAMAVARRASATPEENGELLHARWQDQDPALLTTFAPVGEFGFAKDGPSLAAVADTVTLAFLGTDNRHYTALYTPDAWATFTKLPAGMANVQAFGPSAAALVPGEIELYAAYTGDDARIYYSTRAMPGSAWQPSSAAPPPAVLGPPVGVVDEQGDLLLAYVRKTDGKIAVIKLLTPQNAWAKEAIVDDTAITGSEIAFVRLAAGSYALAWRGFDNDGIYLATGTAHDAWDTLSTVELPAATTTRPVLVHGVAGADLEILYTAGGKLRHARRTDGQAVPPIDVPGVVGATSVAATVVHRAP